MPILPDLKVISAEIQPLNFPIPSGLIKKLVFRVGNIGRAPSSAGDPGVYVNEINPNPPPRENTIRGQKSYPLSSLIPGGSQLYTQYFFPFLLSRKGIKHFEIIVNPKSVPGHPGYGQIEESDYSNNTQIVNL